MSWLSDGRATEVAIWRLTESSAHIIGFVAT
jgi:hypothetical protein